jgi:MFS family permease
LFKKINIVPKVISLSILAALCYFVFIFNKNLPVFFCCNFLLGLSNAAIRIYRVTYLFNLVPNHVIGRVNGILNLTSYFFRFLIGLFFAIPYFNLEEGVIYCMLFLALFCLLGTVIILSRYKILVAEEHKKLHHATT